MLVRGVNPDAITDLISKFGFDDVLDCTSLTRYQLLELLEESTSKRALFQYECGIQSNQKRSGRSPTSP